jgi:hypothetical protein
MMMKGSIRQKGKYDAKLSIEKQMSRGFNFHSHKKWMDINPPFLNQQ